MGQCIKFPLLAPKAICDDKLKTKHEQCPPILASIQNMSCHEILHIFIVSIYYDFMLSSLKQMMSLFKGIRDG
jgi:hypothetical protein